jgi:hypothetical protein
MSKASVLWQEIEGRLRKRKNEKEEGNYSFQLKISGAPLLKRLIYIASKLINIFYCST